LTFCLIEKFLRGSGGFHVFLPSTILLRSFLGRSSEKSKKIFPKRGLRGVAEPQPNRPRLPVFSRTRMSTKIFASCDDTHRYLITEEGRRIITALLSALKRRRRPTHQNAA
jgi:hypothetical protein